MSRHPRFRMLARYVEGTLSPPRRDRVRRHLAHCVGCRETVAFVRGLARTSAELRRVGMPPPSDAWAVIAARRAAGERGILPTDAGERPRPDPAGGERARPEEGSGRTRDDGRGHRGRWSSGARGTAAVLTALSVIGGSIALITSLATKAGADASELVFSPTEPRPGDTIEAFYRGGGFTGEDTLRLRARYRTPADPDYNGEVSSHAVTMLVREPGEDAFRGRFRLPDSVVYAAFAVEDPRARRVDHNHRRFWELLVHAADGRPLFDALVQRGRDLMGRDWELAFESAGRAAEMYPAEPAAWATLAVFEQWLAADSLPGATREAHRERFAEFDRRHAGRPDLPPEIVLGMRSYAIQIQPDADRAVYWSGRVRRELPDHPGHALRREGELWRRYVAEANEPAPDRYFAGLERLWGELDGRRGHAYQSLIWNAMMRAVGTDRPQAFLRWARRDRAHGRDTPGLVDYRAEKLLGWRETRPVAMDWLRADIRRLADSTAGDRPLERTAEEQRAADRIFGRKLLARLGTGLLAVGDTASALDTLGLAAVGDWAPDVYRLIAEARLAAGDTTEFLRFAAKVAADPATPIAYAETVRESAGDHFDRADWDARVEAARSEMSRSVLARADWRRVDTGARIRGPRGAAQTLDELAGGRIALVVYCGRFCELAVREVLDIGALARRIESGSLPFLPIADRAPVPEVRHPPGPAGSPVPIYVDDRGEAKRALENWSFPAYYVLDSRGRDVFPGQRLRPADLPRQIEALEWRAEILAASGGGES